MEFGDLLGSPGRSEWVTRFADLRGPNRMRDSSICGRIARPAGV